MESLIYLIRHGAIDKPSPRSFLGQTDLALNSTGIYQAQSLRAHLQDIPFAAVFSSPLQRAMQTAALVGGRPHVEIQQIEDFKEINLGAWEGLSVSEVQIRFPGAYEQRGQDLEFFRPLRGESFAELAARSYPTLLNLAYRQPGPLLIVAHAGVNRVLLAQVQGMPLAQIFTIPQDYCGVNILRYNREKVRVESINLRLQ